MPNNENTEQNEGDQQGDDTQNEKEFATTDQIEELKENFNSVVGELKDERKKKRKAREERDELKEKIGGSGEDEEPEGSSEQNESPDIESKVREVLREERKEEIKENRRSAQDTFKSRHKELGDDADPGGVKMSAVQDQLERFDLSDATSQKDFERAYEDAYRLAKKKEDSTDDSQPNKYASDPNAKETPEPDSGDANLSNKEKNLIREQGWSKEKYLEQKERRPRYVESLLE